MSHISVLQTQMTEKEFLLQALKDLGYTLEEGELTITGFGDTARDVEIKVKLPLSKDIGFRRTDKGYQVVADWWGVRGLTQKKFIAPVQQRYAYHAACAQLTSQGFDLVSEENAANGSIHLVLRRTA